MFSTTFQGLLIKKKKSSNFYGYGMQGKFQKVCRKNVFKKLFSILKILNYINVCPVALLIKKLLRIFHFFETPTPRLTVLHSTLCIKKNCQHFFTTMMLKN